MAVSSEVKLIEYSEKVDMGNCLTHAFGAVLAAAAAVMLFLKADGARSIISAMIYGLSLTAVYVASATYHGLKKSEAKRIARLVDHAAIPVLIAGTATPCALITLYEISVFHSVLVFVLAWSCAIFGLVSKLFFFQKLRKITMAVYIISCLVMLVSVVPLLGEIKKEAFGGIVWGNVAYLIGAFFCWLGIKREAMHVVFHIFVLFGSAIHFIIIYIFMY